MIAEFADEDCTITFPRDGELTTFTLDEILPERFSPVSEPFRSALIGVAGRPNVGKSTLVNALCGAHVSIVSDKPQTTRRRVAGVLNGDNWQLVLLDLPGFQTPRDGLTGRMQRTVDETLADVDAILFVLDGTEPPGAGDRFIAGRVFASATPVVIAVNKIDRLSAGRDRRVDRADRRAGRLRGAGAGVGPHGGRRRADPATSCWRSRRKGRRCIRSTPPPAIRCGCGSASSCARRR